MLYYTKNEFDEISGFGEWKFDQDALETEREIVRGRDNKLYFAGEEPESTPEEIKAERETAILVELQQIDTNSVRPLRAIADGTATQADKEKLEELSSRAVALRAELAEL